MSDKSWNEQANENADMVRREMDQLSNCYNQGNSQDFWQKVREVSGMLKELRPIRREDRDEFRSRTNEMCNEVKRQMEHRRNVSSEKRSMVVDKVYYANNLIGGCSDFGGLAQAREALMEARELMKSGWDTENIQTQFFMTMTNNDGCMTKEDRQYCWNEINQSFEKMNFKRQDISDLNFRHFSSEASNCLWTAHNGDPYEALRMIKEVQGELRETDLIKERRQEIRNTLQDAYESAVSQIEERKRERERKHNEWVQKTEGFIQRMETIVEEKQDKIGRIQSQIDRDNDLYENARGDDFRDTVQGWIDEKLERLRKLEDDIRDIQSKIDDARDKLNK